MSRKHYTIIRRQEISSNDRFVFAFRARQNLYDFVFFSGRRILGTNTYSVRVYDRRGDVLDRFLMLRTHGRWYIRTLVAIRNCGWSAIARFYRELTVYRANDLFLALRFEDNRSYISANEAVIAIAQQLELPKNVLIGLDAAVAHAAAYGEGR